MSKPITPKPKITRWWLLSDTDVEFLRVALTEANDTDPMGWVSNALHVLDSGLHETDAVPADFAD